MLENIENSKMVEDVEVQPNIYVLMETKHFPDTSPLKKPFISKVCIKLAVLSADRPDPQENLRTW